MRFVMRRDCDLFMEVPDVAWSMLLLACVCFIMTWQSPDIGPTVVALWIEILLAMVPSGSQYVTDGCD
jgi:hypothetical protein